MNENNYEDGFSVGQKDFRVRPQIYNLTNEYDVQSLFLQPHIKTSETVGKGIDEDGVKRLGYVPTGFSELNTTDIQTGVLETDTERAYVNTATLVGMVLYDLETQYNIDTTKSFEFIRGRLGVFMSATKSKNGKLLDAITTKRFIQKSIAEAGLNNKIAEASKNAPQQNNFI